MDVYDGYIFECCFETEKYKKFQCLGVCKINGFQRKDAKDWFVYASGGYALHVVCACLGLIANHRGTENTECLWLRLRRLCDS